MRGTESTRDYYIMGSYELQINPKDCDNMVPNADHKMQYIHTWHYSITTWMINSRCLLYMYVQLFLNKIKQKSMTGSARDCTGTVG
jgi:hypothetical protein